MNHLHKERYSRHIILPEIGESGQEKLIKAKVLVVGAGGLGAPILQYLVAAGIGNIGIMDKDVVSISNLQRQILYKENQIGDSKVERAKEALQMLNSETEFVLYNEQLDTKNAEMIISEYDIVVGATDNFKSRLCINAVSKKLGIPFVHGSIQEFEGQVTVFNYKNGPSYIDLFSETPDESTLPIGVMGVLPGIIGSIQAAEVIKIIIDTGEVLSGRLLLYNALKASFNIVTFGD